MCLPLLAAIPAGISSAMSVAGSAIGAVGSIASGAAASSSYKAQAAFADRQAQMTRQKGAYEGARLKDQNDRQLASMRGQYLSSGIALEGSALDVLQDSATEASLDEQALRFGTEVNASNLNWQAKMARGNARSSMMGGFLDAGAGFVKGLSDSVGYGQSLAMATAPFPAAPSHPRTVIEGPFQAWGRGLW